jgi:two-component sensor histidine kinase/ligand-binding sensor domain-containing protein
MIIPLLIGALVSLGTADSKTLSLDPDKSIDQFVVDAWSSEDGLSQSAVRAIHQTTDGYLWLGTQSGLVRFNGLEFTSYEADQAFNSTAILSLGEDASGRLWVGTHDGLVLVTGLEATPLRLLPERTFVGAISRAADGSMLVGTWTSGLYRCSLSACDPITPLDSQVFEEVQSIILDDSRTWVGTDSGVFVIVSERLELVSGTEAMSVSTMASDANGGLIVASRAGPVFRIEPGTPPVPLADLEGIPSDRVFSMILDSSETLWLGLDPMGLVRIVRGQADAYTKKLPGNRVLAIHEDKEGSLWVGTQGAGLLRLRNGAFTTIDASSGLSEEFVTTLFEANDGSILAGTFGGGLNRVDTDHLTAVSIYPNLPSKNITGVFGNDQGTLWVASIDAGVQMLSGRSSRRIDGLPSKSIYALHLDSAGDLWVGTDEGLAYVTEEDTRVLTVDDGLGSNSIVEIEDDRHGTVWVGTYGGGLTELRADGSKRTYTTEDGLGADIISALHYDDDGVLWIGTIEGGLSTLVDGRVQTFSVQDGLFDRTVFQILEDDQGWLWMGSNRGVTRIEKEAVHAYAAGRLPSIPHESFGTDDGLRSTEINGGAHPAGWKSADGRLWFPTVAGVAVVDPTDLSRNLVPPPVVIERIEADGIAQRLVPEVILAPGTRRVEFKFSALSLIDAAAVTYHHKLEGEDEWTKTMAGNTATYTFLKPGAYVFQVSAANNDGVWNEQGASIPFLLKPYFYQTRWFWMLIASAGFLLGAWGIRLRTRQLTLQREELERMVGDRTRDVMTAKDQVQAQSDALRLSLREKDVLLREVHHRVKNNLQMISSLLQLQSQEVEDPGVKQLFQECRNRIYSFSMVHERLYKAKDMAAFDFVDYLSGLADQLVRSHEGVDRKVELFVNVGHGAMDVDKAIPCGLIVTEFVTNALRHAFHERDTGTISVDFSREGVRGVLTVEDNGVGIAGDYPSDGREGLGLKLVSALVTRLRGELVLERRPIGGTRCQVRFPVGDLSASLFATQEAATV